MEFDFSNEKFNMKQKWKFLCLTIVLRSFRTPLKKKTQRGASTFKCNAGRLLFKNKNKKKKILIHYYKRSF
jgi:hypothetical protein